MSRSAIRDSEVAESHNDTSPRSPATGQPIVITIDGPAGTGKSSVARDLAKRLQIEFLDTGAMYRAATALAIDRGIDLDNERAISELAMSADLHFDWKADPPTLLAFAEPYDHRLRDPDVTAAVSPVSGLGPVREVLVRKQRLIGAQHPRLVTEGRDQGSVVFPDADVKIYLDASALVRARRRLEQLRLAGLDPDPAEIEREIVERDTRDTHREIGPLVCPEGAVRLDTSDLVRDEVVDRLHAIVRTALAARPDRVR